MKEPILQFKKISKSYGNVLANNKISFDVKKNSVHALLGENGAGKSTLVKILYGLLQPDKGEILFNGKIFNTKSPRESMEKGIGMVFQHFSLFESLSVKDNLILGLNEEISYKKLENNISVISKKYGLELDLKAPISTLSAGEKQRVEIVRVLLQEPKVLIMDEPTSVLTLTEAESLFNTLNSLINDGTTIIYITHKLKEVIEFCNDVTILRKGKEIETSEIVNFDSASLATKMVGERIDPLQRNNFISSEIIKFSVKDLSCTYNDPFVTDLKNINFSVFQGEIFGIAGVAGNGQAELMQVLTGEDIKIKSGELIFNQKNITYTNLQERRDMSIGFVPEDRSGHSAVPELSLAENVLLCQFANNKFTKNGIINKKIISKYANEIISKFNVMTEGDSSKASSLSGGNLQKFVIGREILSKPDLLIISHPTWGIDAGATQYIRNELIKLSNQGTSIIIISQDLDELVQLTNRIAVIYNGELSESLETNALDIKKIGLLMGGQGE